MSSGSATGLASGKAAGHAAEPIAVALPADPTGSKRPSPAPGYTLSEIERYCTLPTSVRPPQRTTAMTGNRDNRRHYLQPVRDKPPDTPAQRTPPERNIQFVQDKPATRPLPWQEPIRQLHTRPLPSYRDGPHKRVSRWTYRYWAVGLTIIGQLIITGAILIGGDPIIGAAAAIVMLLCGLALIAAEVATRRAAAKTLASHQHQPSEWNGRP